MPKFLVFFMEARILIDYILRDNHVPMYDLLFKKGIKFISENCYVDYQVLYSKITENTGNNVL